MPQYARLLIYDLFEKKTGIEKLYSKSSYLILFILYLVCAIIHSLANSFVRLFLGLSVYLFSYFYLVHLFSIVHSVLGF